MAEEWIERRIAVAHLDELGRIDRLEMRDAKEERGPGGELVLVDRAGVRYVPVVD